MNKPSMRTIPCYPAALEKFTDPDDKDALMSTLDGWSHNRKGKVIISNLELERFLPVDEMFQLLDVVRAAHAESLETLERSYDNECHKHIARGGMIPSDISPQVIGKAINRDFLAKWLIKEYPAKFINEAVFEEFIERLIAGGPLDDYEKSFSLGSRYLIWVTWNVSNPTDDPFHFVRAGLSDEVRANLGLEPTIGDRLLLFVYERRNIIDLHRPTVADAALFTFFQPPPSSEDKWGLTRPWEPSFLGANAEECDIQPRPEAVHLSTNATMALLRKVQELP